MERRRATRAVAGRTTTRRSGNVARRRALRPVDSRTATSCISSGPTRPSARRTCGRRRSTAHYGDVVLRGSRANGAGNGGVRRPGAPRCRRRRLLLQDAGEPAAHRPVGLEGAFVLGALSGFGVMASHASAELVALHVTGKPLPEYARWFLPSRYDDPAYRALVEQWGPLVGQL